MSFKIDLKISKFVVYYNHKSEAKTLPLCNFIK